MRLKFISFYLLLSVFIMFGSCSAPTDNESVQNEYKNSAHIEVDIPDGIPDVDSLNPDTYKDRSLYYLERNDLNNALNDINKAISLGKDNPYYLIVLSDIYLNMGKLDESANLLLRAIEMNPDIMEPYYKMAELQIVMMNFDQASRFLVKSIEVEPLNPDAYFLKGYLNLERNDTAAAIADFQKTIELDQSHLKSYLQLGTLFSGKQNTLAIGYLSNALEIDPENNQAWYLYGMELQNAGRAQEALDAYNSLLQIDSMSANAYYNKGYIYLTQLDQYPLAIESFTRSLEVESDNVKALYNRGLTYEIMGKVNLARKDYTRCLDLKPNYLKAIDGLNRLDRM